VGLLAAHSAFLKGAAEVAVVDHHADRLELAEQIGAVAINRADGDAVDKVSIANSR
jgi:threonine dehydrogenase-like Zn-dependent dehydrogenase